MKSLSQEQLRQLFEIDKSVIDIEEHKGFLYPVVPTYDDKQKQLHFWCVHCRVWHSHGRGKEKQPLAGHRTVHCYAHNSPFRETGVILRVVGTFSEKIQQQYKERQQLRCPMCRNTYSAAYNCCQCGFMNKTRTCDYPQMAETYRHILKEL